MYLDCVFNCRHDASKIHVSLNFVSRCIAYDVSFDEESKIYMYPDAFLICIQCDTKISRFMYVDVSALYPRVPTRAVRCIQRVQRDHESRDLDPESMSGVRRALNVENPE